MRVWSLGREDPLEKEMATYSSIFAWRIPWKEKPGGLRSMVSRKELDTTECLKQQCLEIQLTIIWSIVEIILEKGISLKIFNSGLEVQVIYIFINDFEEVDIKLVKCAHYMKFSLRVNT